MARAPTGSSGALSYAQLEGVWLTVAKGTKYDTRAWASLMAAIGLAESGGNADATNPTDDNGKQTSWGIWQISNGTHGSVSSAWNNPYENARLAISKLDSQGLSAWGTYDSGAYKGYMSGNTSPDYSGISADPSYLTAQATANTEAASDCLYGFGWGGVFGIGAGNFCLLYRSQARGITGAVLIFAGGVVTIAGLGGLAIAAGVKQPGLLSAVAFVPGVGAATKLTAAAAGEAASSRRAEEVAQERHTANQYRRQARARQNLAKDNERDNDPPF